MRPKANGFRKYLRRIINSKKRAREILEVCQSDDDFSKAALAVVWNELFDLMMNGNGDEVDITKISGIVQKLYGSTNQRKSLELKAEDYERREEERQEKKRDLQDKLERASESGKGLSAEALEQIEEQLKLL